MTYSYGDDGDGNYHPGEQRDDYGLTAEDRAEQLEMLKDDSGDDYYGEDDEDY